jgi:hypothetical protein
MTPKFSFFIKGTREQLETAIAKLIYLGFRWGSRTRDDYDEYPYLQIGYAEEHDGIAFFKPKHDNDLVIDYDLDLILALAQVPDGDDFQTHDFVIYSGFTGDVFFEILSADKDNIELRELDGSRDRVQLPGRLRKATFDEIVTNFQFRKLRQYPVVLKDAVDPTKTLVDNDLLLEIYANADSVMQGRLEASAPQLFPTYKLGDVFLDRYVLTAKREYLYLLDKETNLILTESFYWARKPVIDSLDIKGLFKVNDIPQP